MEPSIGSTESVSEGGQVVTVKVRTRAEMHLAHARSGERRASTRRVGRQMATELAVQVIPN